MMRDPAGTRLRRLAMMRRIWAYQKEHGYAPSLRDLIAPDTYKSTSTLNRHLAVLQREGYITAPPSRQTRSLALTERGARMVLSA